MTQQWKYRRNMYISYEYWYWASVCN